MCGLVGVIGCITHKEEKAFQQLLLVDQLRGGDGTGSAVISEKGDVKLTKVAGGAENLLNNSQFTKSLAGANSVLIGHNRATTRGASTKLNAHPYEYDHIVGAHNGTLTDLYKIKGNQHAVDSMALYDHMSKNGWEATLPELRGAWALTWWDSEQQTFNVTNNGKRPFSFVYSKDRKCMFWASEKEMLKFVLKRCEIEIENTFFYPKDDIVYSFSLPKKRNAELPLYETTKYDMTSGTTYNNNNNYSNYNAGRSSNSNFRNGRGSSSQGTGGTSTTNSSSSPTNSSSNTTGPVKDLPPVHTFQYDAVEDNPLKANSFLINGKPLDAKDIKDILSSGCSCCGATPTIGEMLIKPAYIHPDNSFLCNECMTKYEEQEDNYVNKFFGNLGMEDERFHSYLF